LTPVGNSVDDFPGINQTLSFWAANSASWTAQHWLDCTVRICADYNDTGNALTKHTVVIKSWVRIS